MEARSERFVAPGSGVRLHALHRGDPASPLLVLLHGAAANVHWWDHLAPHWAARFHVVALDFRGHGDSERPEALVEGAFAHDLAALLAHLGGRDPVLVGHSLGGRVALEHAAFAGGVRALALLDVARGTAAPTRDFTRRALLVRRRYRSREEAVARFRFLPPAAHACEALRRAVAEASVEEDADGRFGFKFDPRWFALASRPLPPLERIACPTLLVRGTESELLTAEGLRAFVTEIARAEAVEVAGAGHHVHLDRPDAVRAAVDDFLDRIGAAGRGGG